MKLSGRRAEKKQKRQGLNTLEQQAQRFEWDNEFVTQLRMALSEGMEGVDVDEEEETEESPGPGHH